MTVDLSIFQPNKIKYTANTKLMIACGIFALCFLQTSFEAFSMDARQLIKFARSYKMTSNESVVFKWEDDVCGPSETVLIKKFNIGDKVGAIIYEGQCWGASYSYYEMRDKDVNSIKLIAEISSGRSEHFNNWSSSINMGPKPTKTKMKTIAKNLTE